MLKYDSWKTLFVLQKPGLAEMSKGAICIE